MEKWASVSPPPPRRAIFFPPRHALLHCIAGGPAHHRVPPARYSAAGYLHSGHDRAARKLLCGGGMAWAPGEGGGGLGKWASMPSPPPQSNFLPAQVPTIVRLPSGITVSGESFLKRSNALERPPRVGAKHPVPSCGQCHTTEEQHHTPPGGTIQWPIRVKVVMPQRGCSPFLQCRQSET